MSDVSDVQLRKAEFARPGTRPAVRAVRGSAHRGRQAHPRRGAGCAPGADGRHDRGLLLPPIGTEPSTHGLVYALWKRGSYVLLASCCGRTVTWTGRPTRATDSLVAGPRGLREPGEPPRGVDAVATGRRGAGCPALAVDAAGRRLGRGGGSYDRAAGPGRPAGPADRADLRRRYSSS